MKTAEQYLKEEDFTANEHGVFVYECGPHRVNLAIIIEEYAKQYANQKLDVLSAQIKDCFDYDGNNYKLEIWRKINDIKNK